MKYINFLILVLFTSFMIFATLSLPMRGDRHAPMNQARSKAGSPNAGSHYIQHANEDAHTPNMVTVTLADYRGFDTLGEETVILAAGLVCLLLLGNGIRKKS